jgi:hypothetical protein
MKKLVYTGLAITLVSLGAAGSSHATGLIITGVIDGPLSRGTPKALELFVLNDISELNIYGLGFANNGGGSDSIEFTFSNLTARSGDFLYVASEDEEFQHFFGFAPDAITSAANINGDDAIELFRNGTVVDVFGNIAVDGTGQPWEYLDGWAYRNNGTGGSAGSAFMLSDWHFSGINALDGETANLSAARPFPAGSYAPGLQPRPVPTPEPGAIFLLGSGLAGLLGWRTRKENV